MKTFLKTTSAALFTVLLAGCSGAAEQPTVPTNTDDHHQGETNVAPHDDSMQKMMDDHHEGEESIEAHGHTSTELSTGDEDNTNLPPSRTRLDTANDDHHAGEENVAPHND